MSIYGTYINEAKDDKERKIRIVYTTENKAFRKNDLYKLKSNDYYGTIKKAIENSLTIKNERPIVISKYYMDILKEQKTTILKLDFKSLNGYRKIIDEETDTTYNLIIKYKADVKFE